MVFCAAIFSKPLERRPLKRFPTFTFVILLSALCILPKANGQTIRVDTTHPVNSFRPTEALGAGVDRKLRVSKKPARIIVSWAQASALVRN